MTFNNKLNWRDHVEEITAKARKKAYAIKHLFPRRCGSIKVMLWNALAIPVLQYCCAVWNPSKVGQQKDIENVQRLFLKFLVEQNQDDHDKGFDKYKEHVQKINVKPLWTKRVRSVAIAAFKCWNNIHPNGKEILPAVQRPMDQKTITRRQQALDHEELNICPVGLTNVGLPFGFWQ